MIRVVTNKCTGWRRLVFAGATVIGIGLYLVTVVPSAYFADAAIFKKDYPGTKILRTIEHDGLTREFYIYIPQKTLAQPVPAVLVLHGGGGNMDNTYETYGFQDEAEKYGFIAVFPNGSIRNGGERSWNNSDSNVTTDDVGFFSKLITLLHDEYNVDYKRVGVTGMSAGGEMANRLGCQLTDKVSAIAPVAGTLAYSHEDCVAEDGVAVNLIAATGDPAMIYDGSPNYRGIVRPSIPSTMALWASKNECDPTPTITRYNSTTELQTYNNCKNGNNVIHYKIEGGGHCWPGRVKATEGCREGQPSATFPATEIISEFFFNHTRRYSPPTASIELGNTAISVGQSTSVTWTSTESTSCTGTNFSTSGATAGSVNVTPATTTKYSVTCTGRGGSVTQEATVTVLVPTPPVSTTCNDAYRYGVAVPSGYGAAFNVFSNGHEQIVQTTRCTASSIEVQVGNSSPENQVYAYKYAYYWNSSSNNWVQFSLTSTTATKQGDWFNGAARGVIPAGVSGTGQAYYVGYTCQKIDNNWKCGCKDTKCSDKERSWQLQSPQ